MLLISHHASFLVALVLEVRASKKGFGGILQDTNKQMQFIHAVTLQEVQEASPHLLVKSSMYLKKFLARKS